MQVRGGRALGVVEKPTLEMFWAEAAFHPLKRHRAPLAGVIGEKKKEKDDDFDDAGNHNHHNHVIWLERGQDPPAH